MSEKIYSQAMGTADFIYTSGQIALDEQGQVVGNNIYDQTLATLANGLKAISERGFSKSNIVSVTIYLKDIVNDFEQFNEAYKEFFRDSKPARATVGATLFKPEFLIEIQMVCCKKTDNRV